MKEMFLLITAVLFISCENNEYTRIEQQIIEGRVSALKKGIKRYGRGSISENPVIFVQSDIATEKVILPFEYENKWKVGDSCLLIIEKYKKND